MAEGTIASTSHIAAGALLKTAQFDADTITGESRVLDAAPQGSPIIAESQRLDKSIDWTATLVTRLEDALDHVLAPTSPSSEGCRATNVAPQSAIARWFASNANSVDAINDRLESLLRRIEV